MRFPAQSAHWGAVVLLALVGCSTVSAPERSTRHDLLLRNGVIYDGSGAKAYPGDIAIDGDRITYVGAHFADSGRLEIDVKGQAVAPGLINMLAHPEESFFADVAR